MDGSDELQGLMAWMTPMQIILIAQVTLLSHRVANASGFSCTSDATNTSSGQGNLLWSPRLCDQSLELPKHGVLVSELPKQLALLAQVMRSSI